MQRKKTSFAAIGLLVLIGTVVLIAVLSSGNADKSTSPSSSEPTRPAADSSASPTKSTTNADVDRHLRDLVQGLIQPEKEWTAHEDELNSVIHDVAFGQQKPVLEAFLADANRLHQEHRAALLQAVEQNNTDSADLQWALLVNPYSTLDTLVTAIKGLPRLSRETTLNGINSFLKPPTAMDRCRPVLAAYCKADDTIHTRFGIDLHKVAALTGRVRDLPEAVATYIRDDDLLSAYVVTLHTSMLVEDISFSLIPFETQIYDKSHPSQTQPSQSAPDVPTVAEGVTLNAYQLVQNPFEYKHRLVGLDPNPWPQFLNGKVYNFFSPMLDEGRRRMRGVGYVGMRFNRVLSEGLALYDCMGSNLDSRPGSGMEQVGQLIVTGGQSNQLSMDQVWEVEPLGTQEGTNSFGATVSVALVRFWQYRRSAVTAP